VRQASTPRRSRGSRDGDTSAAGPGRAGFAALLREHYNRCLRPHYRDLTEIAGQLHELYPDFRGDLQPLSAAAISEILAGKRLPQPGWLAAFVLACEVSKARRTGRAGPYPGPGSLSQWYITLGAAPGDLQDPVSGGSTSGPQPASLPRCACPPETVRLTPAQRAVVEEYGLYGQVLSSRIENGDPEVVYRVALLLGADPGHADAARALLIHAAAARCHAATELLDSNPGELSAADTVRHACGLASDAEARASHDEAFADYRCAARARTASMPPPAAAGPGEQDDARGAGTATGRPGPRSR
jgi:hypothetical protein